MEWNGMYIGAVIIILEAPREKKQKKKKQNVTHYLVFLESRACNSITSCR